MFRFFLSVSIIVIAAPCLLLASTASDSAPASSPSIVDSIALPHHVVHAQTWVPLLTLRDTTIFPFLCFSRYLLRLLLLTLQLPLQKKEATAAEAATSNWMQKP
jgi:hypothetical protein